MSLQGKNAFTVLMAKANQLKEFPKVEKEKVGRGRPKIVHEIIEIEEEETPNCRVELELGKRRNYKKGDDYKRMQAAVVCVMIVN